MEIEYRNTLEELLFAYIFQTWPGSIKVAVLISQMQLKDVSLLSLINGPSFLRETNIFLL